MIAKTKRLMFEMLKPLTDNTYKYIEDGFLNEKDKEHLVKIHIKVDNDNFIVTIVSEKTNEEILVIDIIDDGVVTCFIQFGVNSVMLNHTWLELIN